MGRIIRRPNQAVDYGTVQTVGAGNVLGDNDDATEKQYYEDSGSICLYPTFDPSIVPEGRVILAVRAGLRQKNGGLIGFLHNGWVMGYLRVANQRVPSSKIYKQDGFSTSARAVEGAPLYNAALAPWPATSITNMSTDIGSASGEFGPAKDKLWCIGTETYMVLVYDDDVPQPSSPYPAAGSTIATSSVDFNAVCVPTQSEQPVAAIFQVARDSGFTQEVQNFIGGLNQDTTAGTRSYYESVVGKDSYTNLGPGTWYLRMKGRDYRGVDSAWTSSTTFNIVHTALPVPTLTNPTAGSTKATPYGYREGDIPTTPSGERYVGLEWQFSQASDFSGTTVGWVNNQNGRFNAGKVGYTSDPDPSVEPGKNGNKVSVDDPDQYLVQGTWYGRVRCVDIWGQVGGWSTGISFGISHPPVVQSPWPSGGKHFDDDAFPVVWQFTDPWAGDTQSAYRVIVKDEANTVTIHDSNKVTSPFNNTDVVIPDTYLYDVLNLSIQIWDRDDVPSAVWNGTFTHSEAPFITLPYPAADEVVITGQPVLNWSVDFADGASQKSYQIAFIRRDTGVIEYRTNVIASAATTWSAPTTVLKNVSLYQLALTITDTNDLHTTLLRNFSTDYVRPASLSCSVFTDNYDEDGYVLILWPGTTVDPLFVKYNIYRKNTDIPDSEWELIGSVEDPNVEEFHDWSTSGEHHYKFTLTQVVMKFGALVESLFDEFGEVIQVQSAHYWLVAPNDESLNTKLYHVVDDKYTEEIEMATHTILNGGGNRVSYGSPIGMDGTLSAQIKSASNISARELRLRIRALQFTARWVYLRDPFGNYTKVALGKIGIARISGVGLSEFVDVEIPYTEVGDGPST